MQAFSSSNRRVKIFSRNLPITSFIHLIYLTSFSSRSITSSKKKSKSQSTHRIFGEFHRQFNTVLKAAAKNSTRGSELLPKISRESHVCSRHLLVPVTSLLCARLSRRLPATDFMVACWIFEKCKQKLACLSSFKNSFRRISTTLRINLVILFIYFLAFGICDLPINAMSCGSVLSGLVNRGL